MAIVECEIINGQRYIYKNFQWVKVDRKGKLIKEFYSNGFKYKYFDGYGYQPSTFKEHVDTNGKADPYAQLEYCEKVGCPDCYYCVWSGYMRLEPKKQKTRSAQTPKEQTIDLEPKEQTKWDLAAQKVVKKTKDPNQHPLYDYIVDKFQGKQIK
tara:strand:- start:29942 stop:30403 length:462 start_codon:yes stop_codon:yes gene_type:complete